MMPTMVAVVKDLTDEEDGDNICGGTQMEF
jgi:hypothetical protein